jgi:hypothetical protein
MTIQWDTFEDGMTLGKPGPEAGRIVRDEDYDDAARITLERDGRAAPFAITCSLYGWLMHTRFFSDADVAQAEYERMQLALGEIAAHIPDVNAPDLDAGLRTVSGAIREFVAKFP